MVDIAVASEVRVPPAGTSRKREFIRKTVVELSANKKGYAGVAFSSIEDAFREEFGNTCLELLNRMLEDGDIIAVAIGPWNNDDMRPRMPVPIFFNNIGDMAAAEGLTIFLRDAANK